MISLASVLSCYPFEKRLYFDYEVLSERKEKVTLVSVENDYLAFGKSVAEIVDCGYPVVLDCSFDLEAVLNATRGLTNVVAVGGGEFLSVCRVASLINGFSLVAVLTDLSFYKVFQKKVVLFNDGAKCVYAPPLPEKVVASPKKLTVLKRNKLADGFAAIASASAFKAFAVSDGAKELVDEATKCVVSASKKVFPAIFKANLFFAVALSEEESFADGDLYYSSVILSRTTAFTEQECAFFCVPYLLGLYKIIAESGVEKFLNYPKYIERIERLAEIFKVDGCALYQNFTPLSYDEAQQRFLSLRQNYDEKAVSDALATYNRLKSVYSFVYSGRKKRADATKKQIAECLSLAGFYSDGVLKAVFSSGVDELLFLAV